VRGAGSTRFLPLCLAHRGPDRGLDDLLGLAVAVLGRRLDADGKDNGRRRRGARSFFLAGFLRSDGTLAVAAFSSARWLFDPPTTWKVDCSMFGGGFKMIEASLAKCAEDDANSSPPQRKACRRSTSIGVGYMQRTDRRVVS